MPGCERVSCHSWDQGILERGGAQEESNSGKQEDVCRNPECFRGF